MNKFTNNDGMELAEFLNKPAGRNLIKYLRTQIPSALPAKKENVASTGEEYAASAGEHKGYEDCIEDMLFLSTHREGRDEDDTEI